MIQWLGLQVFTAEDAGAIPGQGTKILQATKERKKKIYIYIYNISIEPEDLGD